MTDKELKQRVVIAVIGEVTHQFIGCSLQQIAKTAINIGEEVVKAMNEKEKEHYQQEIEDSPLLEDVPYFNARACRCLHSIDVNRVAELGKITRQQFLSIRNGGKSTWYNNIVPGMEKLGYVYDDERFYKIE